MQKPIVWWLRWKTLSKLKTAKRFATHFSISLHFTSAGITVLGIDLQVTWTRAKTSRLFFYCRLFSSVSLIFSLKISLFIFHHLHAEEISTASRPCGTFSPLPAKALQLHRQLSSKTAPSRGEIWLDAVVWLFYGFLSRSVPFFVFFIIFALFYVAFSLFSAATCAILFLC